MAKAPANAFDAYLKRHADTVHVDAFLHDLNGNLRGKRLPVAEAAKLWKSGLEMPRCMLFLDPTGDDLDPGARSTSLGDPDGAARPIPGLLQPVPWAEEPTAQVLLQMTDPVGDANAGKPSRFCPRAALGGTLAHFKRLGLTPVVAVELEFYLFDRDRDANGLPVPVKNPVTGRTETSKQPYSIDDLDAYGAFIRRVADAWNHSGASVVSLQIAGQPRPLPEPLEPHLVGIGTESITNAVKHAYPPPRQGRIVVSLSAADEQIRLQVRDFGVGPPAEAPASGGLGMRLVRQLVHKRGGQVDIDAVGGMAVMVSIPDLRQLQAEAAAAAQPVGSL